MKKEDQMIDALLSEHARRGGEDDTEFLTSLEKRLDEESSVVEMSAVKNSGNQDEGQGRGRARGPALGIGIAAAFTVAAVGYYGWNQERKTELAINDSYHAAPLELDEAFEELGGVEIAEEEAFTQNSFEGPDFKGVVNEGSRVGELSAPSESFASASIEVVGTLSEEKLQSEVSYFQSKSKSLRKQNKPKFEDAFAGVVADYEFEDSFSGPASRFESELGKRGRQATGSRYDTLADNVFLSPWKVPLSTFSVDVDTASYTNIRRMIQSDQAVYKESVRIEEMINYFNYSYLQPEGKHPFSVNAETASCPWNAEHRLVKVGLQGKDIVREKRPAANLVFLLDVSGSMNSQDKLPLLVDSMKILLKELNEDDSVSIVVYAGAEGVALSPTYVDKDGREAILDKLNKFSSGGSTDGGAGIALAYKMAKKNFVKGGVNRVILGTDGDFNVGQTDQVSLVSMVEREAKSGVDLSVLGFGNGNLNDAMLESITNKGNGNYSYIDSLREGRKVFLDDMMGNLVTIAKDVKIQVEFNPAKVKSYRLIGYANRMLKAEDFKNKRIDAGEIGAGHTVTALYEIVPGNAVEEAPVLDDLEYQKQKVAAKPAARAVVDSPNMLTVKLAYKGPEATKETESTYFKTQIIDSGADWKESSEDFKFASGVALFGMLQRDSEHVSDGDYQLVRELAEQGRGKDEKGYRTEFSDLVRKVVGSK